MKSQYHSYTLAIAAGLLLMAGNDVSAQSKKNQNQTFFPAGSIIIKPRSTKPFIANQNSRISADKRAGNNSAVKRKLGEVKEIQAGKIERSPEAILKLLNTGKKSSENKQDRQISEYVALGQWQKLNSEILEKMPPNKAAELYNKLLSALKDYMQRSTEKEVLLSPDDILALSDISPQTPDPRSLYALGSLMKKCIAAGALSEEFISRLKTGTRYLGTDTPDKKRATGQFLSYTGLHEQAGQFLPTAEEAKKLKDFIIVELHINYLSKVGRDKDNDELINQAWDLNEWILVQPDTPSNMFSKLVTHSLELIPHLKPEQRKEWLRVAVNDNPEFFNILLQSFYQQCVSEQFGQDTARRSQNLMTWKLLQDELFTIDSLTNNEWQKAIAPFTLLWLQEVSKNLSGYLQYNSLSHWQRQRQTKNFVDTDPLLAAMPGQGKSSFALNKDLHGRVVRAAIKLYAQKSDPEKALQSLSEIAVRFPKESVKLAQELLINWASAVNPNVGADPRTRLAASQGIPLTRARQQRNIRQLAQILKKIRSLEIGNLDDKVVIETFIACHSQAEVYKKEDIVTVFGSIEEMSMRRLQILASSMHTRLAKSWSDEKLQQSYHTRRTKKEISSELSRGYELITSLIDEKLKSKDNWIMRIILGKFYFDWAEFEKKDAEKAGTLYDMETYTAKRNNAFSNYRKSVKLYAAQSPFPAEKDFSIIHITSWFNALMGASDLSHLDKASEIEGGYLKQLREAIFSLPSADKHMELFANWVNENATKLPPHVKARYLQSALQVIGNHKAGEGARKLVEFYQELLAEIELHVRLDQKNIEIGLDQDFGAFVTLRHSLELAREGGNFTKYLKDLSDQQGGINYRGNFEKNIREALKGQFEVLSVTFCSPSVKQRMLDQKETGHKGWSETPLAYLHLRSNDPSKDRIPSMQIDLNFIDVAGKVVLPVLSNEMIIDTKDGKLPVPTPRDLKVTQLLDEREVKDNKLKLEIRATAKGVIPQLDDLLKMDIPGFKIVRIDGEDLVVKKVEASATDIYAECERNWVVELTLPDTTTRKPTSFSFLKPGRSDFTAEYKRYEDSDLVKVEATVPFSAEKLESEYSWIWWLLLLPVLAVLALIAFLTSRKSQLLTDTVTSYQIPETVNAFTCATFLMKLRDEGVIKDIDAINADLARIEVASFSRDSDQTVDFTTIARKWHQAACNQ